MKIGKIVIGVVFLVLVVIQVIGIDTAKPEVDPAKDFIAVQQPSAEIAQLIKTACYDCHSFETKYPWYAELAPASLIVGHHIEEAREHLNFSTWSDYSAKKQKHKLHECEEEVEEGEMPMGMYVALHGEANLTKDQLEKLEHYFKAQEEAIVLP